MARGQANLVSPFPFPYNHWCDAKFSRYYFSSYSLLADRSHLETCRIYSRGTFLLFIAGLLPKLSCFSTYNFIIHILELSSKYNNYLSLQCLGWLLEFYSIKSIP